MDESSTFAMFMYGLVVACVAEHLIKHKSYYKGTIRERIGLFATRIAIVMLTLGVVFSVPRFSSDTTCKPDPEAQFPAAECN